MAEITRLHSDQSQHNDLNSQLIQHNKHLDTELANTRERNMNDGEEINKVNYTSSMKEKESQDLVAQTRTLEYDISKQLGRIDDLN